jgi:hypothetical protein
MPQTKNSELSRKSILNFCWGREIDHAARNYPALHLNFASPGALPTWPYSGDWGYYPSGGLGLVFVVVLVLVLMGRL